MNTKQLILWMFKKECLITLIFLFFLTCFYKNTKIKFINGSIAIAKINGW